MDDISEADVAAMLEAGFTPTTDDTVLGDAPVIVICVPTPLSPTADPT